jgi:beta-glucosidase
MKQIKTKFILVLLYVTAPIFLYAQLPAYKNATLPVAQRVKDLLARMTLEEKLAQTMGLGGIGKQKIIEDGLIFNAEKFAKSFPHSIGVYANPSNNKGYGSEALNAYDNAVLYNNVQKYFVEKTRLGIPILCHEESLHGNMAKDGTAFPSHLALGCSWNEALLTEIYTAVAAEVYVRGSRHVLAPVLDLGRDPRWGRTEETLSEDPYLVTRMIIAEINAYQGNNNGGILAPKHIAATLKHFGVHGVPEAGTNVGPVIADERTLRELYFAPFEQVVRKTKPLALMPCYGEISGVPSHASNWQLTQLLRKEWGFNGVVVSDYNAVYDLLRLHKVAKDSADAAYQSIMAGVDVELPDVEMFTHLIKLVKSKKLSQSVIDTAVSRILTMKFRLGLFDNPYTNPNEAKELVGSEPHRKIALKAAHESMVLLKNNNNILPLQLSRYKKIAIIGPNANRCILGGYSDKPKVCITPLEALKEKIGTKAEIVYAEGSKLTDKGDWWNDPVVMSSKETNEQRLKEALNVAKDADLVLLFLGGNEAISREAWSTNHPGDLTTLDLMANQNELVKSLHALNKPMAGFIFSGPPLSFTAVDSLLQAVTQCWYLGQETGTAVADLILGNINPSGKLSITIPRSVGHLPVYYNMKPSSKRVYQQESTKPLYPFGYGLSYTNYEYGNPVLSTNTINTNSTVVVSVTVKNIGNVEGSEIVQLYIRDDVSSLTRPVQELRGFEKVNIKAGETKTVKFTITPAELSFYNANMKKVVEPGTFTIMVGASSTDYKTAKLTVK